MLSKYLLEKYNKIYPHIDQFRGTYRIREILASRAVKSLNSVLELEIYSTKIIAPKDTKQAFNLYFGYRDFGELNQLDYILNNIEGQDVFADVGSSFGLFSSVIAKNTDAEVFSFEPLQLNAKIQDLNREIQSYSFNLRNVAVSDEKGKVKLKVSENSHGQNSISSKKQSDILQGVEKVKLDDELDRVDYIKIDVEGAELQVLRGMSELIEEYSPTILLELHGEETLEYFEYSKDEVLEFLDHRGYQVPEELSKGDNQIILEQE